MKKIKWKNVIIALIFLTSLIILLHDSVCFIFGMSLTNFGALTTFINTLAFISLGTYLEDESEGYMNE